MTNISFYDSTNVRFSLPAILLTASCTEEVFEWRVVLLVALASGSLDPGGWTMNGHPE
jgi:hypothetical protein